MDRTHVAVTPERFAAGTSFDEYVRYVGTPENLRREGSGGAARKDFSGFLREAYQTARLTDQQVEALRWLSSQPNGPAKVLVISEEWSSDCRRDVPTLAKLADVAGWELRIFTRDGERFSSSDTPDPATAPNADLMAQFLNYKNRQTWQSIPVAAFFTKNMEHLYTYVEYPAIYRKDDVVARGIRAPKPGETPEQTQQRADREFGELQRSPFFKVWACAAVDEIISALHERLVLGRAPTRS